MKWFKSKKTVDEFKVYEIIKDWFNEFKTKNSRALITFEVDKKRNLFIRTNYPGCMIGRAGERINRYIERLKVEANVKEVKLIEIRNLIGDFHKW